MSVARGTLLLVNKFYHDVGPAGGVGRYVLQEQMELESRGWTVVPFAMKDAEARPSRWDRYFVKAHDYREARWSAGAVGASLSLIWNREAARRLDALLHEAKPDVAHLHNIYHHLSPSILPVLHKHGVPVVMTLHDLRLLCPAIHMLQDGEVCERCRGGRYWEAVKGRCVKGSRAASLLAAVETAHQRGRKLYENNVDRFVCPSTFLANKYAEWGFARDQLVTVPNPVDLQAWRPTEAPPEDFYLCFGRLSSEKGQATLLRAHGAWSRHRTEEGRPAPRLILVGEGPEESRLKALAHELGLTNVVFAGGWPPQRLQDKLPRARFTVLPSECYENSPLAVIESLAAGVPVAVSRIGGAPELIDEGVEGTLFTAGDVEDTVAALERLDGIGADLRGAARRRAETRHGRDEHFDRLEAIIDEIRNH